jgi:hypothetical protein
MPGRRSALNEAKGVIEMTEQSLTLEENESITLSPDSARFKDVYQQVHPRSASDVRDMLGLQGRALEAVQKAGRRVFSLPSKTIDETDLESADLKTRAVALASTHEAFHAFVHGSNFEAFAQLAPTFDRYLATTKAVINIAILFDIEVANGATLTISASTHLVRARKIIIHQTGRIVVRGSTTFKVVSVEGQRIRRIDVGPVIREVDRLRPL